MVSRGMQGRDFLSEHYDWLLRYGAESRPDTARPDPVLEDCGDTVCQICRTPFLSSENRRYVCGSPECTPVEFLTSEPPQTLVHPRDQCPDVTVLPTVARF